MVGLSTTAWWTIGFAIAGAVVVVAAALLVTIIMLGRRIVSQAGSIIEALDATRENTNPLYDVPAVNHNIERITRGLRAAREGL
jgi:hypothetical protein